MKKVIFINSLMDPYYCKENDITENKTGRHDVITWETTEETKHVNELKSSDLVRGEDIMLDDSMYIHLDIGVETFEVLSSVINKFLPTFYVGTPIYQYNTFYRSINIGVVFPWFDFMKLWNNCISLSEDNNELSKLTRRLFKKLKSHIDDIYLVKYSDFLDQYQHLEDCYFIKL